jgi:hypothetical protein
MGQNFQKKIDDKNYSKILKTLKVYKSFGFEYQIFKILRI